MYMLDTNTCIYVLKNRSEKLRKKFKAIRSLCISSVTYGELCFGIENGDPRLKEERYAQLDRFTQRLLIDPWDEEAARQYGLIRAFLKREGKIIGNNDLLIAAHARSLDAVLVTNNTKEFSRVPDLTLEDWTEN
ncbi:type II toxin-antitoxin system tRNA(fMet)-specific endonuclease VapC [Nitrosomonas halophila]|uniref:Ribonuclease VapC n=1 Tax=Nitrosomonas halophila TaxID=44576 RepID=A0A1H3H5N1_9PROT|nr:PIN domain-containing protein [Nitrosomonas halophila]SDY10218.1 tRNA(fMet)-specific endonuclease VapC [Nitrosomonas halophila]